MYRFGAESGGKREARSVTDPRSQTKTAPSTQTSLPSDGKPTEVMAVPRWTGAHFIAVVNV